MATSVYDRGMLRPFEIAKLKRVFDRACGIRRVEPESEEAKDLALRLLALYNAGMSDEQMLSSAVAFQPAAAKAS